MEGETIKQATRWKSEVKVFAIVVVVVYLLAVFLTLKSGYEFAFYTRETAIIIRFDRGGIVLDLNRPVGMSDTGFWAEPKYYRTGDPFAVPPTTKHHFTVKDYLECAFTRPSISILPGISHSPQIFVFASYWLIALICLVPAFVIFIQDPKRRRQEHADTQEPEATE